ncbi:MAG: hypothetical protein ACRCX8_04220 [Sarcina sp.]
MSWLGIVCNDKNVKIKGLDGDLILLEEEYDYAINRLRVAKYKEDIKIREQICSNLYAKILLTKKELNKLTQMS